MRTNNLRQWAATIGLLAIGQFAHQAHAQCDNITINIAATASTCQSDGKLTVTLTGPDVTNLDMTTAQYAITPVSGTAYSQSWAQAPGGVLTGIPPGTYTVQVRAFCSANNDYVVKSTGNTATIAGNYVVPNIYVNTVRKTFNCTGKYIGRIPIVISGGRAPYSITMTSKPATYTGPTTFSMSATGTLDVDNLPAGNYAFTVIDACTYNTSLTATVGTYTADIVADMIYPYLYMPGSYTADCRAVRIYKYLSSTAHELYPIFTSEFYEIGFTYNATTQPTAWQELTNSSPSSYYIDYTLPVDRDDFKKNNNYLAVWLRIKGTNCAYKVQDVRALNGQSHPAPSYTPVNCDTVQVGHYLYATYIYNFFCWPYQWCVVHPANSTNPTDTIIPWSDPVTSTGTITTKMPYGSRIVYRDVKGAIFTRDIQSSFINSITSTYTYNTSYTTLDPNTGYFPSSPALYASGSSFPVGTRVQYISGPAGTPIPRFSDITTTVSTNYIWPYSNSTSPTGYISSSIIAPYVYPLPGTYTFRVTLPDCGTRDISFNLQVYRLAPFLSIGSAQETCDGLRIFPAGQIQYNYSGTWYNNSTWYSIETAPSGVTVDRTGVQPGGSLLLPASGQYVIKMTSSQSTNTSNYSAVDTIHVTYQKKALALDVGVTSAYVCAGSGTGLGAIRVQGTNGSGNYTYQLRTQGGAAVIQTNTTGVFSYGAAGDTYTVRVIDNDCNTQFDQNVTILDLSDAQITYAGGSVNNVFCEGQTLRVNCITLGSTTYSWTGPNGWTSTQQNPTRPNATPDMSGRYTVTVTPEGCGIPMTQYIDIVVSPCVAAVNPHLRSRVVQ